MRIPRTERGIALMTAVVLVAIATITATAIAFNNAMTARRGVAVFMAEQALRVAEGAEALAAYTLREDLKSNRTDSLDESWAMPYGPAEFDSGVVLEASLEDEQGKFNVNNLVDGNGNAEPIAREEFERLLTLLGMETKWSQQLIDWIDSDLQPTFPDGAEDVNYLAQTPAYRTPNLHITSVSELLALQGFGRDNYQRLLPFITALPFGTTINVCTAPGEVLDAMTPAQQSFSLDAVQLRKRRESGCFPSLADFKATMTPDQWQRVASRVADNTRFFRLRSYVTIGTTRFTLYSLIQRQGGQIRPILRTFGTE
jgi:general secretion pathway protein K